MGVGETLRPGVFVREIGVTPVIEGTGVTAGAMIGQTKFGPQYKTLLVGSFPEFIEKFGGLYRSGGADYVLPLSARGFFRNGGTRLYVSRVLGTGAVAGTQSLNSINSTPVSSLKVEAKNTGAWANDFQARLIRAETTVSVSFDMSTSPTFVEVDDASRFEVGDIAFLDDGSNTAALLISKIEAGKLYFDLSDPAVGGGAPTFAVGVAIRTGSNHVSRTTLATDLLTGATSASLNSVSGIVKGTLLSFVDRTNTETINALVTGVNLIDSTVSFVAITLVAPMLAADDQSVVSQEFQLQILEEGTIVEEHFNLSLQPTNETFFVEIFSPEPVPLDQETLDNNNSIFVFLENLVVGTVDWNDHPIPAVHNLAGGVDGSAPTSTQTIGNSVPSNPSTFRTGIHNFAAVDEIKVVSAPGLADAQVIRDGKDFMEDRKGHFVFVVPDTEDTALEVKDFIQTSLNIDSFSAAAYWPHINVANTIIPNGVAKIDPVGHVQGIWSAVAATRGLFIAPANIVLNDVISLEHTATDDDHDILNPIGVNVIRSAPGRGIRIQGARNLFSIKDSRHFIPVRRWLTFVEDSMATALEPYVLQPINEDLFRSMKNVLERFLSNQWGIGAMFPQSDASQAFFVKVDSETTPAEEVRKGRVIIDIGISPVIPAEKIILRVSVFAGGIRIDEL